MYICTAGIFFIINRLQDDVRREAKKPVLFYRHYFNKVLAEQTASLDKTSLDKSKLEHFPQIN